jgi:cell division protein ZapA (FtsZ GTPase activity inhibitor)
LSCVPWQTPQKLAVGIVGGVLAGILASVLLSYALLKRQYKLKKISEFMKEDLDKP